MRTLLFSLAIGLFYSSVVFAQSDSSKVIQQTPVQQSPSPKQVAIPGVDTPLSGGGMAAQTPNNPLPPVQDNKKRKTLPPSDPRAFGVSVPVGKAKRDTL